MEDAPDVAAQVGPAEQQVIDAFTPKPDSGAFKWVSIIQYAPDGQHILSEIFFFVCPLCGAALPAPDPDVDPPFTPDEWHVDHHRRMARLEDAIERMREGRDD